MLVAPSPPTPEPMGYSERARLLGSRGDTVAALETAVKITARALPPAPMERLVRDQLRTSDAAWAAWLEHGSHEDIRSSLSAVDVPLLVMVGGSNAVIPASLLERELTSQLARARLEIVPDAGHLLPFEAPGAVASLVRAAAEVGLTDVV